MTNLLSAKGVVHRPERCTGSARASLTPTDRPVTCRHCTNRHVYPRRYLPWAPLDDHAPGPDLARRLGVSLRSVYRWRRSGRVILDTGEHIADRIGRHPVEIWGDDYWAAAEVDL